MIKRAYLVETEAIAPDVSVGGLPIGVRQALSLNEAGVADVAFVTYDTSSGPASSNQPALVARAGALWHPACVKRLARTAVAPEEIVSIDGSDAAVYLCGAARVADTVACLARGEPVRADRTLPLAPSEFVVVPRTDADRRAATTLLLRSLEKRSDGIISRNVHRPISRAVTRRLLRWPVTPNEMTLVAAVFGVAGVLVAFGGGYANLLAGAILFEMQNVLDGCDGEIARLKYLRSRSGEWLDQIVDDVLNVTFLAAVGFSLSRQYPWAWWVAVGAMAAQAVHLVGLYAGLIVKAGGRGSVATLRWRVEGGGAGSRTLGDLTRRDFLSFAYVVTAALNLVAIAFVWHALVTLGSAVATTVQWIAWSGPEYQVDAEGATDSAGAAAA